MSRFRTFGKKLLSLAAGTSLFLSLFTNAAFALSPALQSDLTITDIRLSNGKALQIELANKGASLSHNTNGSIYIWIDGHPYPEWTYSFSTLSDKSFLSSGQTSILSPQALKGKHTVVACIDQHNAITESNESNNCATKIVDGGSRLPDLRINSVWFNNASTLSDLEMKVEIENRGSVIASPADGTIGLWYEAIDQGAAGYYELSQGVPRLSPGQIKTYAIPFNATEAASTTLGSYNRFLFKIDQGSYINVADRMSPYTRHSEITESNEANNTFTAQISDGQTVTHGQIDPVSFVHDLGVNTPSTTPTTTTYTPAPTYTSASDSSAPDLRIVSAKILDYNPALEPELNYSSTLGVPHKSMRVVVKNVGNEDAYSPYSSVGLWVNLLRGDSEYGWQKLSTKTVNGRHLFLEKGNSRSFEFNLPAQIFNGNTPVHYIYPGQNTIELTIDRTYNDEFLSQHPEITGYIQESNENNNTYYADFYVDGEEDENGDTVQPNTNYSYLPTYTPSYSNGLKFDVDLYSDPSGYDVDGGAATEVKVKKGDIITFTREVENKNAVNVAWDWNWESMLDCKPYPEFDSPKLRCTVKKNGLSKVSITMFPVTADGEQHTVHSNTIYVTTGTSNSTPTYVGDGGGGSVDTTVSVPGVHTTPPAGYERDVQIGTQANPFSDTNINSRAGKAAAALYNMAIIGGFPDGEFKGSRSVNRAEAAKFLLLSRYESIPENQNNGIFYDVLDGQWYTKYVITAAGLKIINGYNDRSFKPAQTVNTAEFLKMLTLTFDLETNGRHYFTDVNADAWYAQYAGTAYKYNLFPNRSNKLQPSRQLTRNEVAIAIYQYLSQR